MLLISTLNDYKCLEIQSSSVYSIMKRLALVYPVELYAQTRFSIPRIPPRMNEMSTKEQKIIEAINALDRLIATKIPKKVSQSAKEVLSATQQLGIQVKKPHEVGSRLKEHVTLSSIHILSGFMINPSLEGFEQITNYLKTALPDLDSSQLEDKVRTLKTAIERYVAPDKTETILEIMEKNLQESLKRPSFFLERPAASPTPIMEMEAKADEPKLDFAEKPPEPKSPTPSMANNKQFFSPPSLLHPDTLLNQGKDDKNEDEEYDNLDDIMAEIKNGI